MNKNERKKHVSRACGITPCEWCLVWGFPCTIMLVISTLAAFRIGIPIDGSPSIELCVFFVSFALQVMVYYTVFQYMITSIGCMFKVSVTLSKPFRKYGHTVEDAEDVVIKESIESDKVNSSKDAIGTATTSNPANPSNSEQTSIAMQTHESSVDVIQGNAHEADEDILINIADEETESLESLESNDSKVTVEAKASEEATETMQSKESAQPMQTKEYVKQEECVIRNYAKIPELSSEAYIQRNEEYMAELEAERSRVLAAIIEYVHYTMSCFMKEEDMPSFCQEIVNWADDPYYAPKSANLKVKLSTIELRHFIWNIGERLGRENGYDGYARALFAMSLFSSEFSGIEVDTVKNFTVEPRKGRIKLDRLDPESYEFHYPRKILP